MFALRRQRSLSILGRAVVILGLLTGLFALGAVTAPSAHGADKGWAWVSLSKPKAVNAGRATYMYGKAGANGQLVPHVTVYLHYKVNGEWTYYTRTTTNRAGAFSFTVRPRSTTTFRAVIVETGSYHQGTSYEVVATVWGGGGNNPAPSKPAPSGNRGWDVVNAAASQAGKPYRFGAAGPHAYDCSGLVRWAYQRIGISLPHSATAQSRHGRYVNKWEAAPGDLILFGNGRSYYHVGIYAGNGEIWHAPTPGQVVKRQRIWTQGYTVRRVV